MSSHANAVRNGPKRRRNFITKLTEKLFEPEPVLQIDTYWKVSEWLAASLEMKCPAMGCGFESRAFRCFFWMVF